MEGDEAGGRRGGRWKEMRQVEGDEAGRRIKEWKHFQWNDTRKDVWQTKGWKMQVGNLTSRIKFKQHSNPLPYFIFKGTVTVNKLVTKILHRIQQNRTNIKDGVFLQSHYCYM